MRFRRTLSALALAAPLLSACTIPENIIRPTQEANTPDRFIGCKGFGCGLWYTLSLDAAERARIETIFTPLPASAAEERAKVALAVAEMERIRGAKVGTTKDVAGTFLTDQGPNASEQLDCFAEASNTTISMQVFRAMGFVKFHTILEPEIRGWPYKVTGGISPHSTARLADNATGIVWAIDSWYTDNGGEVYVVEFNDWAGGWHPPGSFGMMMQMSGGLEDGGHALPAADAHRLQP